jgi:hypothetical protein
MGSNRDGDADRTVRPMFGVGIPRRLFSPGGLPGNPAMNLAAFVVKMSACFPFWVAGLLWGLGWRCSNHAVPPGNQSAAPPIVPIRARHGAPSRLVKPHELKQFKNMTG